LRASVEVGGLGIVAVRAVLDAIADESLSADQMLGVAHHALGSAPDRGAIPDDVVMAREEVDALLAELGWAVSPEAPSRRKLADELVAAPLGPRHRHQGAGALCQGSRRSGCS
jgi:hypothetical protein